MHVSHKDAEVGRRVTASGSAVDVAATAGTRCTLRFDAAGPPRACMHVVMRAFARRRQLHAKDVVCKYDGRRNSVTFDCVSKA